MVKQGFIPVTGGNVAYWIHGEGDAIPLLTLHGGPGFCHDYLESLIDLAGERPVIFYDQLGCGDSDRPGDQNLWTVERFREELQQVVAALGLTRFHLLGQSWGTMLATEYALTMPDTIVSLIMASPPLSIPRWLVDCARYRAQLPAQTRDILDRCEAAGDLDSPEYEAATMVFYQRHLCRLNPWPPELNRSNAKAGMDVYHTMWGPTEFNMTGGSLATYDRSADLHRLARWPVLFTCGRYDEAAPETTAWYQSLVPGSELAVFDQSSHTAHLEERAAYITTLCVFLRRAESQTG